MEIRDLLERLDERWRDAFSRFVETGEAEPDFLKFMDGDRACQEIVEEAIRRKALELDEVSRTLVRELSSSTETISRQVADALQRVANLQPSGRSSVLKGTVEKLETAVPATQQSALQEFVTTLGGKLER